MDERELLIRALHALLARLHNMRAGLLPYEPHTIALADDIGRAHQRALRRRTRHGC